MENQSNSFKSSKTNNTISTTKREISQFSNSRLTAAAIFAFVPFTGVIGVHNFVLKQYKRGVIHIVLCIVAYIPYIIDWVSCNSGSCNPMVAIMTMYFSFLEFVSYAWAIVEGVQILRSKKQTSSSLSTIDNSNNNRSLYSATYTEDASHHVTNHPPSENNAEGKWRKNQNRGDIFPILSFAATLGQLFLGGSNIINSSSGAGGAGIFIFFYFLMLGIPLAIISIVFGIVGLKSRLCWLSIISLSINAIMLLFVLVISIISSIR